jgi:hypothetical protein
MLWLAAFPLWAADPDVSASPASPQAKAAKLAKEERLRFEIDRGWKPGRGSDQQAAFKIQEFVRNADDRDHPREWITFENLAKPQSGASLERTFRLLRANVKHQCPEQVQWQIIEKTPSSIVYEWTGPACQDSPDTHEIARIMEGRQSYFIVKYTAKTARLPDAVREKWLKRISEASLEQ